VFAFQISCEAPDITVVVVACEVVVACVVVVANVEVVSGVLVVDGIMVVVVTGVEVVVVVGINVVVVCRVVDVAVRLQPVATSNKSIEHFRKFDRIQECNIGLSDAMFRRKASHG
jgi:hypothetical protein